jgi:hypothetical protein
MFNDIIQNYDIVEQCQRMEELTTMSQMTLFNDIIVLQRLALWLCEREM